MAQILLSTQRNSFDPEAISILSAALEDAWCKIEASGSSLARPGYARACARCWPSTLLRKLSTANVIGLNSVQVPSNT